MRKILIGCEFSGRVRDAFRAHPATIDAWSCDLIPCENGGPHFQGDILAAIRGGRWDFIGLHPPCTALCVSGNHRYAAGKPGWAAREEAVEWTRALWEEAIGACKRVYLENPQGVLGTMGGLPAPEWVQPWHYGDDASKRTGLTLHGLPPLPREPRRECPPRYVAGRPRWGNQTDSGQNRLGPSATRAAERARTYPGVAAAMARHWAPLLG
jgi:hypothetical protein